ncbi:MAG TPA: MBL fold metallo-hydrolase [Planktothrix sp.]|jgi:glyoxylase-like metal-dependent hydrolase (beta-lactamase superfamily II)
MKFGEMELSIIREGTYKLDGGAMFGVVPKPLWSKTMPCDELNRVTLSCNLLLIESGGKKILVETGMGDRWAEKDRERYEVRTFLTPEQVVTPLGLKPEDIDVVIISHLHFDHVGGAVRSIGGKLVPTYPRAKYYIQRGEWEFAYKANARAKASYRPDDFEPLKEHGVLELIDGDTEIVSGVWARVTGGHTSHHQIITFESQGQSGVYFADIMPMLPHLSPPWVMGYDHFPLDSCDVKHKWLSRAVEENWLIVFDHETGVPWGHVRISKDRFEFVPLAESSLEYRQPAGV